VISEKTDQGNPIDKQQVISHYIVKENNNIALWGRFFHQDKGVGG